MTVTSPLQSTPLTAEAWETKFTEALDADYQTHEDLLIQKLRGDADTLYYVADHVRRYVTDYWKEINENRSLYGAEIRQKLEPAIAGQKNTIRVFELALDRLNKAEFDEELPVRIDPRKSLEAARALLAELEYMQAHAPNAFNLKSLGYAGDLQTLCSLEYLLRHRLGESSLDTIATLLDCAHTAEGHKVEVVAADNLRKRLGGFREKYPRLVEQTEAAIRLIPRK
jgi:hypothetical protein